MEKSQTIPIRNPYSDAFQPPRTIVAPPQVVDGAGAATKAVPDAVAGGEGQRGRGGDEQDLLDGKDRGGQVAATMFLLPLAILKQPIEHQKKQVD